MKFVFVGGALNILLLLNVSAAVAQSPKPGAQSAAPKAKNLQVSPKPHPIGPGRAPAISGNKPESLDAQLTRLERETARSAGTSIQPVPPPGSKSGVASKSAATHSSQPGPASGIKPANPHR